MWGVVVVGARLWTQLDSSGGGQDEATASPGGRQSRSGSHEDGTARLVRVIKLHFFSSFFREIGEGW